MAPVSPSLISNFIHGSHLKICEQLGISAVSKKTWKPFSEFSMCCLYSFNSVVFLVKDEQDLDAVTVTELWLSGATLVSKNIYPVLL